MSPFFSNVAIVFAYPSPFFGQYGGVIANRNFPVVELGINVSNKINNQINAWTEGHRKNTGNIPSRSQATLKITDNETDTRGLNILQVIGHN